MSQERNERAVREVWERRLEANPYFTGKRCEDGCGTVCYDENAYKNHMCRPEVMKRRSERVVSNNMAAIIICDRCGQIATAKVAGGCAYEANAEAQTDRYALCPNCSRELYDFLHMKNKDVRAIMAPFNPEEERPTEGEAPTQADTSRAAIQAEYGTNPYPPEGVQGQTRY